MKDDKKQPIADNQFKGLVVKKTFGAGSKSEHEGIFLETDCGDCFKLRRMGGNPFNDPQLNKFIGKTISASGVLTNNLLIAKIIKATK